MSDPVTAIPDPLVTVLMSVHNGEEYLTEAISSILAQTFTGFELLIVDDGSTDKSREIIDSFSDNRIKLISLKQNVGLVCALNEGLGSACGQFIARMDADDVAEPQRLQQQLAYMLDHPNTVLLGTSYKYIDGVGRNFSELLLETCNETLQTKLLEGNQFCHPSIMMRRKNVLDLGGYRDIAGLYAEDYDLWLRLAEQGAIANLAEPLLRYRVHEKQISVSKTRKQRKAAELYKALAKQRRNGEGENILNARKSPLLRSAHLRLMVAKDYLYWANLYKLMGHTDGATSLILKAACHAPTYAPARVALLRQINVVLGLNAIKNNTRWYVNRVLSVIFRR